MSSTCTTMMTVAPVRCTHVYAVGSTWQRTALRGAACLSQRRVRARPCIVRAVRCRTCTCAPAGLAMILVASCVVSLKIIHAEFPWTLVQGTIHTRTLKNKLLFQVHEAAILDQNRPGRAFLRPTSSGDVPSLSVAFGKKRTGPPEHHTKLLTVAMSSSSVRSAAADRG